MECWDQWLNPKPYTLETQYCQDRVHHLPRQLWSLCHRPKIPEPPRVQETWCDQNFRKEAFIAKSDKYLAATATTTAAAAAATTTTTTTTTATNTIGA